jgi:hypothetical protein
MATYRLEAKIIGRSQGRSATASAAYRAAEQIDDARTGQGFDYTRKRGVLHTEIIAPAGTPEWMADRAQLWNAVERAEKRKDAQLAREILLSLPHELTPAQRIELVQGFARQEFVAEGMIADIAVHAPDREGDNRNHHCHVMLTMRELTGDGFGPKVRAWNSTEQLEAWREHWAQAVNAELERHGHSARVDHRSLADQGLDREPEPKQGPIATEMEREGRPSHAGDDRRAAQARNAERAALADEQDTITAEIFNLEQERAKRAGQGGMSGNNPTGDDAERQAQAELERLQREAAQWTEAQRRQETERQAEQQTEQITQQQAQQRLEDMARENADIQVRQAEDMREQRTRLDKFEADQKRQAEEAQQEAERKREAEARGQQAEGEIRDAGDRYRVALGQHYDVSNPYGSLSRAAMAEYGAFIRDREQLKAEIAKEQDPEARRALELRQEIEANDYMAITSKRIASQSEVITGRRDSEEAVRFRERAAEYEEQSKELRQQYRNQAAERAMRDAAQREDDDKQRREREEDYQASKGNVSTQSPNRARQEEKTSDHEPTAKGEISDAKAERIAKIREQGRAFESDQKAREATPSQDRGRSR